MTIATCNSLTTNRATKPKETMGDRVDLGRPVPLRLLRVLVVDDDRDTADSLTTLLRLWGHDAWSAYGGAAALQSLVSVLPDVLLLDVAMPQIGGYEVARRLRLQRCFAVTRIVAVSGYVDQAHQITCYRAGFDDFLPKPLDMMLLESILITASDRLPTLPKLSADPWVNREIGGRHKTTDSNVATVAGWRRETRVLRGLEDPQLTDQTGRPSASPTRQWPAL